MNTKNTQNAFGLYCRTTVGGAALLASMIGLAACSDSDSSDNNSAPYEMKTVAAADKLPSCTDSNVGQMAYIESTQEVVYCAQNNWLTMKGADGKDGASCSVKSSDKGYDVYCGSELVGTLSNGENGAQGIQGEKGDKGDKGDTGAQGIQGEKGDTGAQGIQGEKGDTGAQGAQGIQGEKGDTGAQGAQGIQGEKGDTGAQGAQGIQGEKGDTGAQGAQGIQGEKGDTGAQGAQGIQGEKGDTGAQGIQGEKGDTGAQGDPGVSCIATMLEDESGAAISCGGEYVGTIYNGLNGDKGDPGENCTVTDAFNGNVTITCDNESVTVFKAMCFTNAYDPDSLVCIRGKLFKPCELDAESDYRFIDTTTHFCQVTRNEAGKITAAKAYGKCKVKVDGQDELASVTYDPEKQFCANNADENLNDYSVQDLCGTDKKTFLPKTQFCAAEDKDVHDLCDIINAEKKHELVKYDPTTQFCANNKNADLNDYSVQDLCINGEVKKTFYPKTQFCAAEDKDVHNLCGTDKKTFDPTTEFCAVDGTVQKLCINGTVKKTFNPGTQFCAAEDKDVHKLCAVTVAGQEDLDLVTYDPTTQFCANNADENLNDYSVQDLCINGEVKKTFYPKTQFCAAEDKDVHDLCEVKKGSSTEMKPYNPITQFCATQDKSIRNLCGRLTYDPTKKFCWRDETDSLITDICEGNPEYNPKQYKCALTDNSLPKTYELIKFVKVGDQIWSAENMLKGELRSDNDYETGATVPEEGAIYYYCYKNEKGNCYTEDAETKVKAITGGGLYKQDVATKVCPVGWHLPSKLEFETLVAAVGANPKSDLVKMVGYNFNITNEWETSWSYATETRFWSSTVNNSGKAYTVFMKNGVVQSAEDSYASITDYVASVRCIEDSAE